MATRQTSYTYIERITDVQGGDPVIRGTRVPVWSIVIYQQSHETIDDIEKSYPRVSREAAKEALAYYEAHREEIDAIIAENDALAYESIADD